MSNSNTPTHPAADSILSEAPGRPYAARAIDPSVSPASAHLQALEAARYRYIMDHGLIMFDEMRTVIATRDQADADIDRRIAALPGSMDIPEPVRSPSTIKPATDKPAPNAPANVSSKPSTESSSPQAPRFRLRHALLILFMGGLLGFVVALGNEAYIAKQRAGHVDRPIFRCNVVNA